MRTFTVSDELYEHLKSLVVDPFDDTPDIVIGRLIEIVNKAKNRWSPFDICDNSDETLDKVETPASTNTRNHQVIPDEEPMVLL